MTSAPQFKAFASASIVSSSNHHMPYLLEVCHLKSLNRLDRKSLLLHTGDCSSETNPERTSTCPAPRRTFAYLSFIFMISTVA
ncbi:hypothetical protein OROGR_005465 [Orobanche gracilis]